MNKKKKMRILSFVLSIAMVLSMLPVSTVSAYFEEPSAEGNDSLETTVYDYTLPVGVTMERLSGSGVSETDNLGDDLLFVIKQDDRYYAMKNAVSDGAVPAVDITDWINEDGTLTVPEDTRDVAFIRYEQPNLYDYGMFINGSNNYLTYSYSYEEVDGDGDHYNDAERNYTGTFKIEAYSDYTGSTPYYHSENGTSGTLYFSQYWSEYYNSYNSIRHFAYTIADLRSDGAGGKEFYYRCLGTDVEYVGNEVEGYVYFADCRHQDVVRHAEYDAPTCMLKGCEEYWYCENCNEYMKDAAFTEHFGQEMPVILATGHDWDDEKCQNCNRPVPVYSLVTNQADFNAHADDTMYIIIAEYEGKYYTPNLREYYLYSIDSNHDGFMDIYDIDENNNGVSDMFETHLDENGNYEYLSWDTDGDGVITEIDMLEYHDNLVMEYFSNGMYGSDAVPASEIQINSDGTFSHEAVKNGIEFEMIDLYTEENIDQMIADIIECEDWWSDEYRYTYECMKQFVIPNMYISAPNMLPIERMYLQHIYDFGDSYSWGTLFFNNAEEYKLYNYSLEEPVPVNFLDICDKDQVVLFGHFDNHWNDRPMQQLRFRDYNGEFSFVSGYDYDLDGSEYVEDPETGEGYYDTHDTQVGVYLYASQQPSHICDFGDWVDDEVAETHTRTCKDPECGKTETKKHAWDDGVETKAPTCTEAGELNYTCTDCGATKNGTVPALDHEWSNWSDTGENSVSDTHTRSCQRTDCNETERENHEWGDWVPDGAEQHKKTCDICSGIRTASHQMDAGVVTTPATEEAEGVKTYTCADCSYTKTEAIPKLEHVHRWEDWVQDDETTHSRSCRCNETQTEEHHFDDGEVINWATHLAPGAIQYTCTDCGFFKIEEIPALEEHEWTDWSDNADGTHSRSCICNAVETADCAYDNGVVVERPTHEETGIKTYTCIVCGHSYDEEIPVLTDHEWDDWIINKLDERNTHIRFCICNESQIAPHVFDDGKVTIEPTHTAKGEMTYTCNDCGYSYTEEIPTTPEHEWTYWYEDEDSDTHTRLCKCGASETKEHNWSEDYFSNATNHWHECTECAAQKDIAAHHGGTATITKLAECDDCKAPYGEYAVKVEVPFNDVTTNDWFNEYVGYVNEKGLMTGLNETTFGPAELLSRAQFAVILHRMQGEPKVEYTPTFPDVPANTWYTDAVLWANQNGIITGYENGHFGAADNITREQMAVMMYRYAKAEGFDITKAADLTAFPDAGSVSAFARDAVAWAIAEGLITGDQGKINPQGNASRAVCATIITRFDKNVATE